MPELPDVEIYKRYIDATSLHKRIRNVEVRTGKVLDGISIRKLRSELQGRSLMSTKRHGKYLFVTVGEKLCLMLHFGMTGNLRYLKDLKGEPPYSRILFHFENGYSLIYISLRLLGKAGLVKDIEKFIEEKKIGPDAIEIDLETFKETMNTRRGHIKSALMDQRLIAGIGNIYSDEILFQSGIHPRAPVRGLDEEGTKMLFRNMKRVLKTAIDRRADPEKIPMSYMLPHRQKNGVCPRCGDRIQRMKISGRSAYYCPSCQKA